MSRFTLLLIVILIGGHLCAQDTLQRCAAVQVLQMKFQRDLNKQHRFEEQRAKFNRLLESGYGTLQAQADRIDGQVYTIPVIFHVVLSDQSLVTDDQVKRQLAVLNSDFAGTNADSSKIPDYFKSLFGKSIIQFCLAQRTPAGLPTSGIDRVQTTRSSFSINNEGVKYSALGGTDGWDNGQYMNIWICGLSGGILGYSSFPDDDEANLQGVVVDYRAVPGGQYSAYNGGKTLTHETGHFFNLYHIWGDDNGSCSGTDHIDDTPQQGNSTNSCISGIKLDNCSASGNGIMYQNYMDYTADACLVMFTSDQVSRMEAAVSTYYSTLAVSKACQPIAVTKNNASLTNILHPEQRVCKDQIVPVISIKNNGSDTLRSLSIITKLNDGTSQTLNWKGLLAYYESEDITLNAIKIPEGNSVLSVAVSDPGGNLDEDKSDDSLSVSFQYYPPVTELSEGFESNIFPAPGWDIVNPDHGLTWKKIPGISASGNAAVFLENYGASVPGHDDLRSPQISIGQVDSAFLSFKVAAVASTLNSLRNNIPDTLEVLASVDCGQTYTSLYKKTGSALSTSSNSTAISFVPSAADWRKDSVNLVAYIDRGDFLIAFRSASSPQNNIYLDDIHLRTVVVNPNLKEKGFLVTPNPARNQLTVEFYPAPEELRAINLYSITGQKLMQVNTGLSSSVYRLDISSFAPGTYILSAVFSDKVVQRKIIKAP
jgi:hypothetical protein